MSELPIARLNPLQKPVAVLRFVHDFIESSNRAEHAEVLQNALATPVGFSCAHVIELLNHADRTPQLWRIIVWKHVIIRGRASAKDMTIADNMVRRLACPDMLSKADATHLAQQIELAEKRYLQHDPTEWWDRTCIVAHDTATSLLSVLEQAASQDAWSFLLEHAATATGSKPTKRWLERAGDLVAAVPKSEFCSMVQRILEIYGSTLNGVPRGDLGEHTMRGLVWCCGTRSETELSTALGRFAQQCGRKVAGVGPASTILRNASTYALGAMPKSAGIGQLSQLITSVRHTSGRQQIERALDGAALRAGQSRQDLEDASVPTFGLGEDGTITHSIGAYDVKISLQNGTVRARYIDPNGHVFDRAPQAMTKANPIGSKALKTQLKDLETGIAAQAKRIEHYWILQRATPWPGFRQRVLRHPLLACIAENLLWVACSQERSVDVMCKGGSLFDLADTHVTVDDATIIRLWHPVHADTTTLPIWRDRFEDRGIRQPFPQLWREAYRALEGEVLTTSRFAGHYLHYAAFREQCQRRGWTYRLQGQWDNTNDIPHRDVGGFTAEFHVTPIEHPSDRAYPRLLKTAGLSVISREDMSGFRGVPPIILSEFMRDADLLVAHTTVANDPNLRDEDGLPNVREYWNSATLKALSESERIRADIAARVISRTSLRSFVRVEHGHLVVSCTEGEYMIRLRSGMVFDPRGVHVAIPIARADVHQINSALFPFEGDSLLSEALARCAAICRQEGDGAS